MLEREIEGLLSVDAAPDFRARVRQRLAQEPPLHAGRPLWHLAWTVGAGSAIAAAAIAVAFVLRPNFPADAARELDARGSGQPLYEAVAPAIVPPSTLRSTISRKRPRIDASFSMELIVHASEAAAWRQLLSGLDAGDVELSFRAQAEVPAPEASSEDFLLPPIVIEPLAPVMPVEGVHP